MSFLNGPPSRLNAILYAQDRARDDLAAGVRAALQNKSRSYQLVPQADTSSPTRQTMVALDTCTRAAIMHSYSLMLPRSVMAMELEDTLKCLGALAACLVIQRENKPRGPHASQWFPKL